MRNLAEIRTEIDKINEALLNLLNQRARLALEVGAAKQKAGAEKADYYRPERELGIINDLIEKNPGPLRDAHIKHIFQAIMASSLALQQPLRVAYLGPLGSESHLALQFNFGLEVEAVAEETVPAALQVLEEDQVEFAVLPLEHLHQGYVVATLEGLIHSSLRVVGEIIFKEARFLILGKTKIQRTGRDKTALLISNLPNEAGALFRLLEPFQRHHLNISMPVLRPAQKKAWNYVFFLEVEGHEDDAPMQAALNDLRQFVQIKVLGSYPLIASLA